MRACGCVCAAAAEEPEGTGGSGPPVSPLSWAGSSFGRPETRRVDRGGPLAIRRDSKPARGLLRLDTAGVGLARHLQVGPRPGEQRPQHLARVVRHVQAACVAAQKSVETGTSRVGPSGWRFNRFRTLSAFESS